MSDAPNNEPAEGDDSGRHPDGWAAWDQGEGDGPATPKRPLKPAEEQQDDEQAPQP